ncbi:disheveled-associated activator of morphogenesis 1 [Eurytemora carolleeae]|uniref:disheveled-associated activator of morphogenesis 1 n=1 Tax=Eurytemora carolleeae TaxID=1294199 RepID=UPI000C782D97|nr:disheveled-associated activator of morphogenesis 1 [Eurytemora carolleeae]|eukprot:XP_023325482.1 disheveled-associated activator of morphogenesis 1-like [Eurytemora affinis]
MNCIHIPDQLLTRVPSMSQILESFPSVNLDSLPDVHVPRLPNVPRPPRLSRPDLHKICDQITCFHQHLKTNMKPGETYCRSPSKGGRRRRGWCGCLSGAEDPPEITYCVADNAGGGLSLQAITPTTPMPSEDELNDKFAELVEELDLSAPNKAAMLSLPLEKKWIIWNSRKGREEQSDLSSNPEYYTDRLREVSLLQFPGSQDEISSRSKQLDCLQIALRTQPHSFVSRFLEENGLNCLLDLLAGMDWDTAQSSIHTAALGCMKALMNNTSGRAHVLAHPTGVNIITQSLSSENVKTRIAVLEILGAMCLVPGGHKRVLDGMVHYQEYSSERTRFQGIINDLDRSTGKYRDDVSLKTTIMSFVNAVLNYGAGTENLEFRLHLRFEFLMLGIQPVIEKLKHHENETLNRHLDFFEMVRIEDEKELAKRFDQVHVDTKSASNMFECLRAKLNHTPALPHLLSVLQHALLLPLDYGGAPQHWMLFDKIVQQIVLQSDQQENPDITPININVNQIIELLAREEEILQARTRAEELEKENQDLATNLSKKEQEIDLKLQEKEDLEANLARTREKLETEVLCHNETKQRLSAVETRSVADIKLISPMMPPPPPPAAPPPPMPPGPPPPPMLNGVNSSQSETEQLRQIIRKCVPQPSNPLKSFNWSKLPECKVQGTIWTDLDDSKLYKQLDLAEVDRLFSAYQKNGIMSGGSEEGFKSVEGSIEDLRYLGTMGRRAKIISVIDSRRAQNCTILLSKLKLSNDEISKAIMTMDARDQFPVDMVEQMLKFTPSPEERALLDEHAEEIDHLARADRFLFELSKITHYEQRLRTLHYKKKFNILLAEIRPKIQAVLEGSKEVQRSKRLRKMLELILAFGNYMNRGQRGNALGFKLNSLTRIADTKSSCNKNITLLHFMADTCEHKFRDCLFLEADLPHIKDAAKVNMKELEKDMNLLRVGMKEVERELEFYRGQQVLSGDRYLPVMKEFVSMGSVRLAEMEDLFTDMKSRFDRVCRLFCEDPAVTQSDEFFGIFDHFITCFQDARQDNDNAKKKKEEEEKIAKQHQERKSTMRMRTLERKKSNASRMANGQPVQPTSLNNGKMEDQTEFDDLISALRTGDVFGENMDKFKRNRKLRTSPPRVERMESFLRERSKERILN